MNWRRYHVNGTPVVWFVNLRTGNEQSGMRHAVRLVRVAGTETLGSYSVCGLAIDHTQALLRNGDGDRIHPDGPRVCPRCSEVVIQRPRHLSVDRLWA